MALMTGSGDPPTERMRILRIESLPILTSVTILKNDLTHEMALLNKDKHPNFIIIPLSYSNQLAPNPGPAFPGVSRE